MTEAERLSLRGRIEAVLDASVRPALQSDGGGVELVDVDDDRIVQVRVTGSCTSCPSSVMTVVFGIEATVKEAIPEIRFLEAVP